MCYTSYAKGAHVTSSTPSSVLTKKTKICDSYNPISNLFFSSETDSKTLHVSSTKEFAFRPLHPSPSNSSAHTQWSRPPPPFPFTKALLWESGMIARTPEYKIPGCKKNNLIFNRPFISLRKSVTFDWTLFASLAHKPERNTGWKIKNWTSTQTPNAASPANTFKLWRILYNFLRKFHEKTVKERHPPSPRRCLERVRAVLYLSTGGPSLSCELILLRNKSHGEMIRVCMGIFTHALGNKKYSQTSQ